MSKFCGFPTCVCERELERESMSDERRELIVMLYWIQMRERQAEFWSGFLPLLLFLPLALSFFCLPLHPSEWKYFRGLCLSEPRGKSTSRPSSQRCSYYSEGHPLPVPVELTSVWILMLEIWSSTLEEIWSWTENPVSCLTTLEAEFVNIFISARSVPVKICIIIFFPFWETPARF